MNNKQYPTRMHEVLGVETKELFSIKGSEGQFYLNDNGDFRFLRDLYKCSTDDVNPYSITKAINHGIIRKPRLSEEQVKKLHAALLLGFKWLTVNSVDELWLFGTKPRKFNLGWGESIAVAARIESEDNSDLSSLVSWSDPAPLDIVATLKAAGVEVE